MKQWVQVLILLGIVLFISVIATKDWDFSRIGNIETIDLSGSIQSSDGRIKFYPETMDVTYNGVYINIRFKIDKEIRRLGFDYNDNPRFYLLENPSPKLDEDDYYHSSIEEIHMQNIEKYTDADGNYLRVFFRYGDIQHLSKVNSYRIYLEYPGGFFKKTNDKYSVKMDETKEIKFDGLGTYQIRVNIQENGSGYLLHTITKTYSDIGNPFSVNEKVIGFDGENTWATREGSGFGHRSDESSSWAYESKNVVTEEFVHAENYQIEIHYINIDIEHSPLDAELNSLDLRFKK